jgi:hypothetical protein
MRSALKRGSARAIERTPTSIPRGPALVHAFLVANKDRASGLTIREGSKYLPAEMQATLRSATFTRTKKGR